VQVVDAAISESIFNMLEGCVPEFAEQGYDRPPSGSTISGAILQASHCLIRQDGIYSYFTCPDVRVPACWSPTPCAAAAEIL